MDNSNALNWFLSRGRWTGSEEFDLSNMKKAVSALGNPQDMVSSVHIAGTNGKGSTASSLAALLASKGKRVGLNTSPHLVDPLERFLLDGYPVRSEVAVKNIEELQHTLTKENINVTFHEAATLLAFLIFRECDIAIYEVGLGGRLDASNVLTRPDLAIITSISMDHQKFLGDTIESIAREKGGIIKPGVPLVLGKMPEKALKVLRDIADQHKCEVFEYSADFNLEYVEGGFKGQVAGESISFQCGIRGGYQASNLACALMGASLLGIDINKARSALENVYWPCRLETIEYGNKYFLLDCAHNSEGIDALLEELDYREMKEGILLFAMLERPDWQKILEKLKHLNFEVLLLSAPSERTIEPKVLKSYLSSIGVRTREFDSDYQGALDYCLSTKQVNLVAAGSIYMLGKLRPMLAEYGRPVWTCEKY